MLTQRGFALVRLDGQTAVDERQSIIRPRFNASPSIFAALLSTRAAEAGISLTSADVVVLHDLDFNPQNDRQAQDRCHRIGQTRPVRVMADHRGTVDERIHRGSTQRKLRMDAAVLRGGKGAGRRRPAADGSAGGRAEVLAAGARGAGGRGGDLYPGGEPPSTPWAGLADPPARATERWAGRDAGGFDSRAPGDGVAP